MNININTFLTSFDKSYINTKEDINIVILGNSSLALETIEEIISFMHFPNILFKHSLFEESVFLDQKIALVLLCDKQFTKKLDVNLNIIDVTKNNFYENKEFDRLAKYIHFGYKESYNPYFLYDDKENIEDKWNKAKEIDKKSSLAQAKHISFKLKILGLKYEKNTILTKKEILKKNKKIFADILEKELISLGLDDNSLQEMTKKYNNWETFKKEFSYFPSSFTTLIEKLIRVEKNRWNAYHYLKNWRYNPEKTDKSQKEHRCLISIDKMHQDDRFTILYDLYAILYIPNLLASVGYKILIKI